jgi:hypothetical protein
MTVRMLYGAVAAIALMSVAAPAYPQDLLPRDQGGLVTVAGCLQMGGKHGDEYVLASPIPGPVNSVQEATCKAPIDSRALDLDDVRKAGMNESLLGHWIEVNGRLEKEESTDPDNLRELGVRSFRVIPVIPPRAEAAAAAPIILEPAPAPTPTAEATPPAEEKPVATTGTLPVTLPKTASPIPIIGLLGLFALAGGFALRVNRLHDRG